MLTPIQNPTNLLILYRDENGIVTLKDTLDFETSTNYEITLVASDGELTSTSVITFDISDVDEAPSLSSTLKSESFEETIAVGTALASISSIDPESQTITYSLSGTGSAVSYTHLRAHETR